MKGESSICMKNCNLTPNFTSKTNLMRPFYSLLTAFFLVASGFSLQAQAPVVSFELEDRAGRQQSAFTTGKTSIELCGLQPGYQYGFQLTGMPAECLNEVYVINAAHSQVSFKLPISFRATGTCVTIELDLECDYLINGKDLWMSAYCLDCKREPIGARYGVSQNGDVDYLIREVFIGGGCFDVTGVTPIGNDAGMGEFFDGGILGIETGVLLATGNVQNSVGPNNSPGAGNSLGSGGDPDLTILAGQATFDATGIEFDFRPTIDEISFRYVFGSEEYPEYVCASFNDVFGFFISGPGISGPFSNNSINIANIPGVFNLYVGINSVNPGVPGAFGNAGNCVPQGLQNSQFYVDNPPGSPEIQYDGWTTVFTAEAIVQVCGTYHIKLVIADAGDAIFDSGVFLEANSFNAGGIGDVSFTSPTTGTNVVYRNCNDGVVTICKASPNDIGLDVALNFTVDPQSTAIPGVDYAPLISPFFIPAGEECIEIPLEVFPNPVQQGPVNILLALELPCSCENPFVEIIIDDVPPLSIELDDQIICAEEQITLSPTVSGGIPQYGYSWSTGDNTPNIFVTPTVNTSYTLTVTDECGQEEEAVVNIEVLPRPIGTLEVDGYLCADDPNGSVTVTVTFDPAGSGPWNFSYAIDGDFPPGFFGVTQNPFTFQVNQPGFIYLLEVSSPFCEGWPEGDGLIEEVVVETFYDITPVSCQGIEDGAIQAYGVGINDPYEFFWSGGYGYTDLLEPIGVGTYYVTVTDGLGCTKVDSVVISSPSDIELSGVVLSGTECFAATGAVSLFINGGQAPYQFQWSNGSNQQNPNNLPAGVNTVTVTDSRGCESYESFNIVASDAPVANADPMDPSTCGNPNGGSAQLNVTGGTPPYAYEWTGNGGTQQNPSGLAGGLHVVTITDDAGCTTVAEVVIPYDTLAPVANAGLPDTLTCDIASLELNGTGSSQGGNFTYQWQTSSGLILSGGNTLTPTIGLPGNYTLIVTNTDNGCTSSSVVPVIPDEDAPLISFEEPEILTCQVTSVVIDASASSSGPNFNVSWSTPNGNILSGGTSLTPAVNAPGLYILTITNNDNNCVSVQEVIVDENTVPPVVNIQAAPVITCSQTSVQLNGSGSLTGPGVQYNWSTANGNIAAGAATLQPTVNQPGTYTLIVTNGLTGCTNSLNVTVDEDRVQPIADAGVTGVINCTQTEVELVANGSSTGPRFVYQWNTLLGNITGDPNSFTTTVNAASTYSLTVIDTVNGCQSLTTVQVFMDTVPPIAFAGPPAEINCANPQTLLDGSNSTNMPFTAYQWTTNNGNIVSGAQSLTPMVNQGGTYFLVVTNEINGCTAESFVVVTGDFLVPQVIIQDPPQLTCAASQVILDGSQSDFNSAVNFQWTTIGGNILSGGNTVTPTVNQPGQYTLSSLNTNNGCSSSQSVVVTENRVAPIAHAGPPREIFCLGDTVMLDGSLSSTGTFFTYDWYLQLGGPAVFLNQQRPLTDQEGTYFLIVTDTRNGCTDLAEVIVTADYLTSAQIQLSDPVCFDDPGTLEIFDVVGGLFPYEYSVNGGQNFQYNPRFRNLGSGQYQVVVRDAKGCEIYDQFEIPEVNELLVYVEPEIRLRLGERIELEAQLNIDPGQVSSITWYPAYGLNRTDSLIVEANPFITTPYFVTVIDTFGCEGSTQFKIVVTDPDIFIPNAFSPYNNDGNNDKLMIFAGDLGIEEIELFEVFSRWGERVFKAEQFMPNDEKYGWDGLHKGQILNPGVFVYYAKVRLIDQRVITVKGDVTLVD
jgi:hypothetical protein